MTQTSPAIAPSPNATCKTMAAIMIRLNFPRSFKTVAPHPAVEAVSAQAQAWAPEPARPPAPPA